MEENKTDIEERLLASLSRKLKKAETIKAFMKIGTLLMGVLVIVFTTFADVGPNEDFNLRDWIANSAIMTFIIVFGMLWGESVGKDTMRNLEDGRFRRNADKYKGIREKIRDGGNDASFPDWYAIYKEKEYKQKIVETLDEVIADKRLCTMLAELTAEDLPFIGDKVYIKDDLKIRKLSPREKEIVRKVILDGVPYHTPKSSYYLTAFGESGSSMLLEQKDSINKEIAKNTWFTRGWRILFSLVVAFLWAFMTVKDFSEVNKIKAWANLISRLFSLLSGLMSGFGSGATDTKLRAELLQNKYEVLSLYSACLESGSFKPKSYDELIQEQLKEEENGTEQDTPREFL